MRSLLSRRQRAESRQLFRRVVVRILGIPPALGIVLALILGVAADLAGLPGTALAMDFIREVAGPVVLLQAKLLLIVGSIGALFFIVGGYRIDILASYVADKLNPKIMGIALFWASMLAGVHTLLCIPESGANRLTHWNRTGRPIAAHTSGESPQLE